MKRLNILFVLLFLTSSAVAQNEGLSVFDALIGKTWYAEGKWGDGSIFKQETTMEYGLGEHIVISRSKGFTDEEQKQFGDRSHGVRQYDSESGQLKFWEFDVFGGLTEGRVFTKEKSIYFQYTYGNSLVTDGWEYVDEDTYNFKVGSYENGEWKQIYLSTQYKAVR